MNTCRFCGGAEIGRNASANLVKYSVRHYAHHACYLDAGKTLDDLPAWMVGEFPFRVIQARGLLDKAQQIVAADMADRVRRLGEEGRRP